MLNRENKQIMMLTESEEGRKRTNRLIIVMVILALLGALALFWLIRARQEDSGWREITAKGNSEPDCSSFFTFWYQIQPSEGGRDFNAVQIAYTEAVRRAYKIFDTARPHEGIQGLWAVNANPGAVLTVEPELYQAFALMEEYGGRFLYLAPVYAVYNELFFSRDDGYAKEWDPYYSSQTAEYFADLMPYLGSPEHIRLELLGENRVCLQISEEYRRFARENEISVFLDFYWMQDAFLLDLVGESILATGYRRGYIVSREGWVFCLDDSEESYALIVSHRQGDLVRDAAQMRYRGPSRIITLKNYTEENDPLDYYYIYEDGRFATAYIDPADGYYKSSLNDLLLYSHRASCGRLLLEGIQMMLSGPQDAQGQSRLESEGIWPVYFRGDSLVSGGDAEFLLP